MGLGLGLCLGLGRGCGLFVVVFDWVLFSLVTNVILVCNKNALEPFLYDPNYSNMQLKAIKSHFIQKTNTVKPCGMDKYDEV